jgi:hypothetical protein
MAKPNCLCKGCGRPSSSLGLCVGHYTRFNADGRKPELNVWLATDRAAPIVKGKRQSRGAAPKNARPARPAQAEPGTPNAAAPLTPIVERHGTIDLPESFTRPLRFVILGSYMTFFDGEGCVLHQVKMEASAA